MAGDAPAMRARDRGMRLTAARCTPAEVEAAGERHFVGGGMGGSLEQARREIEVEKMSWSLLGRVHCDIHFQRGSLVVVMRKLERLERLSWAYAGDSGG